MKKRELFKNFDYKGRKWRIGKFDAMTGSFIAYKLMAEVLPMGLGAQLGVPMGQSGKTMSKQDFIDLQRDCLGVCFEMLDAGPTPVLNANCSWGVADVEFDAPLILALTIQALMWNVTDFFGESGANLADILPNLNPLSAKT